MFKAIVNFFKNLGKSNTSTTIPTSAPSKHQEVKVPEAPKKTVGFNFRDPKFVRVKGLKTPKLGQYKTKSGKFSGLVVHYTESGRGRQNAINVLKWLVNEKGWVCKVMDEDGNIYIPEDYDIFKSRGIHAGKSKWKGQTNLNDYYDGMEVCGWGGPKYKGSDSRTVARVGGYVVAGTYQKFTQAQEDELTNYILWADFHNDEFSIDRVCGHDEAREQIGMLGDKQDPGGALSMSMPAYRNYLKNL